MRIDGLDNIEIPSTISIAPSIDTSLEEAAKKEKIASWLTANVFYEIFTNSITNSRYFSEKTLETTVSIINSLSEGLDVMRPSMLPTGLETIAYNLNRKNNDLKLFEFGKTYSLVEGVYSEKPNLSIYISGNESETNWSAQTKKADIYFVKGVCEAIFKIAGLQKYQFTVTQNADLDECLSVSIKGKEIVVLGAVNKTQLEKFSIKQPVYFICFDWKNLLFFSNKKDITFEPVSKFPAVQRDLSILLDKSVSYAQVEELVESLHIKKLQQIHLFDVFENEKLGENKKSFAIDFTFLDKEKTMTDEEIGAIMDKIISNLESKLNAVIRSNA